MAKEITRDVFKQLKIDDRVVENADIVSLKKNNDHTIDVTIVVKTDRVMFAHDKEGCDLLDRMNKV